MTRAWTVLGIPIDSVAAPAGGTPFGTELSPRVLRDLDLVTRLGAEDAGDLEGRITGPERESRSGIVGWPSLGPVTTEIRSAVADLMGQGARPLLIGGCCALLPGAVAGARDAQGRIGLAYVDGHVDVYDNRTSPTGEAADMPVAALLGIGWPGWLETIAPFPVIDAADAVILGARDEQEARDIGDLPQRLGLTVVPPEELNGAAAERALKALPAEGFWLHLDLDVLNQDAFPATDYLMPGGIDMPTLSEVLRPLGQSSHLMGVSIGCYNPSKDPELQFGQQLVDLLADVLATS